MNDEEIEGQIPAMICSSSGYGDLRVFRSPLMVVNHRCKNHPLAIVSLLSIQTLTSVKGADEHNCQRENNMVPAFLLLYGNWFAG